MSRRPAPASAAAAVSPTSFPQGAFGDAVRTACQVVAQGSGVAALRADAERLRYAPEPARNAHARLLGQLADGLVAPVASANWDAGTTRWS